MNTGLKILAATKKTNIKWFLSAKMMVITAQTEDAVQNIMRQVRWYVDGNWKELRYCLMTKGSAEENLKEKVHPFNVEQQSNARRTDEGRRPGMWNGIRWCPYPPFQFNTSSCPTPRCCLGCLRCRDAENEIRRFNVREFFPTGPLGRLSRDPMTMMIIWLPPLFCLFFPRIDRWDLTLPLLRSFIHLIRTFFGIV